MVIWITGLSGSGKTTLAEALWIKVKPELAHLVMLDGDVVREIFGGTLGHSEPERVIQIKRIQNLAKELEAQGLIVVVTALYSHPDLLTWNRNSFENYFEVYLSASLDVVRDRDSKGLYAQVEAGTIIDVVGVDIPYHVPLFPDMTFDAGAHIPPAQMAGAVINKIPLLSKAA